MVAKLDRLSPSAPISGPGGTATPLFSNLWQRTMTAIEQRFTDLAAVISGITEFAAINIGGDVATGIGTTAGTLAAGDDSRIVGAVQNTRQITAGTGLAGGGTLAADRTLSLASMVQATIKGRAAGAGTGSPSDLTATQVKAILAITGADVSGLTSYATVATDADFTITRSAVSNNVRHTGALTANRAVTLSTTGAVAGDAVVLTRTGTGAFNLTVAGKALAINTWAHAVYDGSAWYLSAYGAL